MTVDIISNLAFGDSFNEMDKAQATDFHTDFLSAFDLVVYSIWDLMYFPRLRSALTMLPSTISILLGGPRGHFARLSEVQTKSFHSVLLFLLIHRPDYSRCLDTVQESQGRRKGSGA